MDIDIPIAPTRAVRDRKVILDEIEKECQKKYLENNGWGDYADWKMKAAIKVDGKKKITEYLVNCVTLHRKYGGKSRRRKSKKSNTKRKTKRKTKKGKNSRKLRTSKKHV